MISRTKHSERGRKHSENEVGAEGKRHPWGFYGNVRLTPLLSAEPEARTASSSPQPSLDRRQLEPTVLSLRHV